MTHSARGLIVAAFALLSACSGKVDSSTSSATTSGSGGAGTGGTASGGAGGVNASGGSETNGGAENASGGTTSATDAGTIQPAAGGASATLDGGAAAACKPGPLLLPNPSAGDGSHSGCPEKQCTGFPLGADLSETYTQDLPASQYTGCTEIVGTAVIASSSNTDLSELSCLERVTGDLLVWNNPGLTSLHGLESLVVVSGSLGIGYDAALTAANRNLTTIDALSSLVVVGQDFHFAFDPPISSLDGVNSLEAVGGTLTVAVEIDVSGNSPSVDLTGFRKLKSIGGDLSLWNVYDVSGLSGLSSLQEIRGSIAIAGVPELSTLSLPALECLGHDIQIVDGYLMENTALTSVGPFPKLRAVGGWVRVEGNPNLTSIRIFDTVTSVGNGTVRIVDNPLLNTMPVNALSSVQDDIIISGCPLIEPCPLLDLYSRLAAGGYRYHLTLDSVTGCNGGKGCDGPICVSP